MFFVAHNNFFANYANAQSDKFIPNSGFEENFLMGNKMSSINSMKYWNRFLPDSAMTAQYYVVRDKSKNVSSGIDRHYNIFLGNNNTYGYQAPYEGNAIVGLSFFSKPDYLEVMLNTPLVKSGTYRLSMRVSLAECSQMMLDAIPVIVSKKSTPNSDDKTRKWLLLRNETGTFLSDTTHWIEVFTLFKSDGNEKYLTIGAIEKSKKIKTRKTGFNPFTYLVQYDNKVYRKFIYYFIDNIELTEVDESIEKTQNLDSSLGENLERKLRRDKIIWLDKLTFTDFNPDLKKELDSGLDSLIYSLNHIVLNADSSKKYFYGCGVRYSNLSLTDSLYTEQERIIHESIIAYPGYTIKEYVPLFLSQKISLSKTSLEQINEIVAMLKANPAVKIYLYAYIKRGQGWDANREALWKRLKLLASYIIELGVPRNQVLIPEEYHYIGSTDTDCNRRSYLYESIKEFYVITMSSYKVY